jgi:hypothetical protein
MLGGLLLIYFVGRSFFRLAGEYGKNEWGFAILGVASYYAGLFMGGMILGVVFALFSPGSLDTMSDFAMGLMALPLGVLSCWGLYMYLKRSWRRVDTYVDNTILDSDFVNNPNDPNKNL